MEEKLELKGLELMGENVKKLLKKCGGGGKNQSLS